MGAEGHLMVAEWPEYVNDSMGRAAEFEKLRLFVTDIRRLRAEQGVDATKKIAFGFVADEDAQGLIGDNLEWIKRLTNTSSIDVMNAMPDNWVVATSGTSTIGFNKADGVDLEAERVKLEKELVQLEAYIKTTDAKLSDAEFSKKAPENVVRNMSDKLEEAKEKAKVIKSRLS
jgi:valyl-tRNA synthetase